VKPARMGTGGKAPRPAKEASPPPPEDVDEHVDEDVVEQFEVETFLGVRTQYLVKWVGYPNKDATWQTEDELKVDLGDAFGKLVEDMDKDARKRKRAP